MDYHGFYHVFPTVARNKTAAPPRPDPSASPPALAAPARSSAAEGPRPRPLKRPQRWMAGTRRCDLRIKNQRFWRSLQYFWV